MQTSELKDILIQGIQAIEDKAFLCALKVFTGPKTGQPYKRSEFEVQKIFRAREHVKNGEIFT